MNSRSTYNPSIHHRRSIRLKGYDYSQQGLYFVTLCVKNRHCLFGEIVDRQMILNDAGVMVNKWYHELENKFPDIKCHEHIVMPNHFHCIVENTGGNVGADLRVCPNAIKLVVFKYFPVGYCCRFLHFAAQEFPALFGRRLCITGISGKCYFTVRDYLRFFYL